MAAGMPASNNPLATLLEAARADPKKAGVLAVLVTVLGTMWIRMAMKDGGGPSASTAATVTSSDNDLMGQTTPGGRASMSGAASAALAEWRGAPVSPVVRNLFTVPIDNYLQTGERPASPVTRVEDGFWDELAKSLTSQADQHKQRQIRTDNVLRDAAKLQLQTILMSASPKAVIDGEVVGEGSVVAEFRVLKIEPRRIIVEREGIKLEIPMK